MASMKNSEIQRSSSDGVMWPAVKKIINWTAIQYHRFDKYRLVWIFQYSNSKVISTKCSAVHACRYLHCLSHETKWNTKHKDIAQICLVDSLKKHHIRALVSFFLLNGSKFQEEYSFQRFFYQPSYSDSAENPRKDGAVLLSNPIDLGFGQTWWMPIIRMEMKSIVERNVHSYT